jgi:hypothetical protein
MSKIMEGISPLPWTTTGIFVMSQCKTQFAHDVFNLPRPTGSDRVDERNQRNAAYIVHACNLYPKLVEALEEAKEYFENRADAEYVTDSPQPVGNEEMRHLTTIRAILAKCKAGAE